MLHELPYHLIHAGKWEELRDSLLGWPLSQLTFMSQVIIIYELLISICVAGNLDWLHCKIVSCGVASVIQDLSLCVDVIDCPEIQLLRDCFILLKPTLDFIDGHTGEYRSGLK